jgi:hypothetical protein
VDHVQADSKALGCSARAEDRFQAGRIHDERALLWEAGSAEYVYELLRSHLRILAVFPLLLV